jgi:excisionase family DNA binding protein
MVAAAAVAAPPEILTPEECAALLRVRPSFIYAKSRKRQRNPLPVYRIGRYLRFIRAAVLAWLEGQGNQRKGRS